MSHFSVLVITDERPTEAVLARVLARYHEFECTGHDDQYVVEVDRTQEALDEYASATIKMVAAPDGVTFYDAYEDRFYRDPTPDETKKIGPIAGTGGGHGMSWTSKDWGDGLGYRAKVRDVPAGHKEIDVPVRDVQPIAAWIEDWYGSKAVVIPADEVASAATRAKLDLAEEHKYGYALVSPEGNLLRLVKRTNPNAKWDWYQLGGRFTGIFRPHYDPELDPANKETCWLCKGTGKRADGVAVANGCNGCRGTGIMTKWPTKWRSVGDVVQVQDVPLEALRNIAESTALARYDKAHQVIAGREIPSWDEMREKFRDIDAVRNAFWSNQVVNDLKAAGFNDWGLSEYLVSLRQSRPEFATRARRRAVQTYAVVKDGKWHERGEMGWWGMASNEKDPDEWDAQFAALLDGLPPETWLAVVDCHI